MLVQGVLQQDPFTGHLFVFRGRTRANLIKIIYWDCTGFCLFTKRLAWVTRRHRPASRPCLLHPRKQTFSGRSR